MKHCKWVYNDPVFESDALNHDLLVYAPWAGHRRFAYDYVRNVQPNRIVELGSHYGCSAFAFLQAIKDGSQKTEFFAVDTWQGDDFTKNDYTEDVYAVYKRVNDTLFGGVCSQMMRMRFDEAVDRFPDGSIDLLHIDGSHNYEDIRRDYESWHRKVSADGVVFFHDISDDLFEGAPMGSHIFWEELKQVEPFTVEFPFSNGLGVLFRTGEQYESFIRQVSVSHYQQMINYQDTINKDLIRRNSFVIRDLKFYNTDLQEQIRILNHHLGCFRTDTEKSAQYLEKLEERCVAAEKALAGAWEQNESLGSQLAELRTFAESKESYAADLERQMAELRTFAGEKERYADDLEQQMAELRSFAESKERYCAELESQMSELRIFAESKEAYAAGLEGQMAELRSFAESKERYCAELESQMSELRIFAESKEAYAAGLEGQMAELRTFAGEKERYADDLKQQMAELRDFAASKERYCAELESQMSELRIFAESKETYADDLEQQIAKLRTFAESKERYSAELESQMSELRIFAESKEHYAADLEGQMAELRIFAESKERYSAELEHQMAELQIFAESKERYSAELEHQMAELQIFASQKENYASDLEKQMGALETFVQQKDHYVHELLQQLRGLNEFLAGKEQAIADLERDKLTLEGHVHEKNRYIAELEREKDAAVMLREENTQLLHQLAEQKEAHENLASAYNGLNKQMEELCNAIRRIPFGDRYLKAVLASIEEES